MPGLGGVGVDKFTLRGEALDLDRGDVEKALRGVEPESVTKHAAEINGKLYPVKQVLAEVLEGKEISRLDFTSADARRILRRLGFRLFEEGPRARRQKR